MPVPTLYPERVLLKLRAGTCANINAMLKPAETGTDRSLIHPTGLR